MGEKGYISITSNNKNKLKTNKKNKVKDEMEK